MRKTTATAPQITKTGTGMQIIIPTRVFTHSSIILTALFKMHVPSSPSFHLSHQHQHLHNLMSSLDGEQSLLGHLQGEEDECVAVRLARENAQYEMIVERLRSELEREGLIMQELMGVLNQNNQLIGAYQGQYYQVHGRQASQSGHQDHHEQRNKLGSLQSTQMLTVSTDQNSQTNCPAAYSPQDEANQFLAIRPSQLEQQMQAYRQYRKSTHDRKQSVLNPEIATSGSTKISIGDLFPSTPHENRPGNPQQHDTTHRYKKVTPKAAWTDRQSKQNNNTGARLEQRKRYNSRPTYDCSEQRKSKPHPVRNQSQVISLPYSVKKTHPRQAIFPKGGGNNKPGDKPLAVSIKINTGGRR